MFYDGNFKRKTIKLSARNGVRTVLYLSGNIKFSGMLHYCSSYHLRSPLGRDGTIPEIEQQTDDHHSSAAYCTALLIAIASVIYGGFVYSGAANLREIQVFADFFLIVVI